MNPSSHARQQADCLHSAQQWNLAYNNYNYSYTTTAVGKYGYATLSYDRPGIGASQHGNPLNFVQSWTEMAALEALTTALRNGTIKNIPKFTKILHGLRGACGRGGDPGVAAGAQCL